MEQIWLSSADELMRIGKSKEYPQDGRYALRRDIAGDCGTLPAVCGIELDGQGHAIGPLSSPLFLSLEDATIRNLTLELNVAQSAPSSDGLGGLCCSACRSLIDGVETRGRINGAADAGGLAGSLMDCDVVSCKNTANVGAEKCGAGGICSYANNTNFLKCINTGNVSAVAVEDETSRVGGITGTMLATWDKLAAVYSITECLNEGEISGGKSVGGIAGYIRGSDPCYEKNPAQSEKARLEIAGCVNRGDVHPSQDCTGLMFGGIVGEGVCFLKISNCRNAGGVWAHGSVGGIIGDARNPTWKFAEKSGDSYIAPIPAPRERFTVSPEKDYTASGCNLVENCENLGSVTQTFSANAANAMAGGIAGSVMYIGSIAKCTNRGTVCAHGDSVGGIAGKLLTAVISGSSNAANVTSEGGAVGGIVGCADRVLDSGAYPLPKGRNRAGAFECINTAEVKGGADAVGGIAGALRNGSVVLRCENAQSVSSVGSFVGGIVGMTSCESVSCNKIESCAAQKANLAGAYHVHRILGGWDSSASALLEDNTASSDITIIGDNTTDSGYIYANEPVARDDPNLAEDAMHGGCYN
ncbi:MAG: hypothetical protein LBD16_06720 [Oscillospiraceae bacterium]|jgi:hypothetical protein|nr:hypothetical protein [Oscillospiraceae bacterium]